MDKKCQTPLCKDKERGVNRGWSNVTIPETPETFNIDGGSKGPGPNIRIPKSTQNETNDREENRNR